MTTNVSGASIKIVTGSAVAAEGTIAGTTFTTDKIPAGTYELIVTKEGYKEFKKNVIVNGDINETVELEKIATATTATVKAIGAKKIQVTYDGVVDPAKAKISVKKGAVVTDIEKITFSDDKTVATIETKARLIKGDYVVTTSDVAEKDIVVTLAAEDEKVAKIDVTTKTAPYIPEEVTEEGKKVTVKRKASVNFVVLNQYGEDVTATYGGNITWTSSTSDAVDTAKASKGYLVISNGKNDFVPGNKVYLTGVYAQGGVAVNAELTIGVEKKADEVIFKGVYNKNTKKIENLPAGFKDGRYVLLFEVKDQYGNKMDANDVKDITGDDGSLVFTSDNPLFISSEIEGASSTFDVDDKTYLGVGLKPGAMAAKGGKATIQVISKVTGKISTYEINAESLSQVKTLTISAPQSISVVGEEIEVPFSAVDQNGNAVTNYKQLKEQVTPNASDGTLYFKEKDDGTAKLIFNATGVKGATDSVDAPVYLSTMVTDGGNFSNVLVNVKAKARPVAVIGVDKNTATSIARGGSVVIKAENVVLQDQYGRTMEPKDVKKYIGPKDSNGKGGYQIKVESEVKDTNDFSPFEVATNSAITSNAPSSFTGDSKSVIITQSDTTGSDKTKPCAVQIKSKYDNDLDAYNKLNSAEKISFSLLKLNEKKAEYELVAGSEKIVTFSKVTQSEFVKYEVDDLGVMYNDAQPEPTSSPAPAVPSNKYSNYKKTVSVYGIKEDGTKVAIPKEYFTVTTDAGDKLTISDEGAGNEITDAESKGYGGTDFKENSDPTGKDITKTVKVSVAVKDYITGAIVTTIVKDLVLSKDDPKIATIGFNTKKDDPVHFVENGKATAHGTRGEIADLGDYIKLDDVKDQYGVKNSDGVNAPLSIKISDISMVDDSAFKVESNDTASPKITGAALGDKFKVTYTYEGGKSEVVNFTVGADSVKDYKSSDQKDIDSVVNTLKTKNFNVTTAVSVNASASANLLTVVDAKGTTIKVKGTTTDNANITTVSENKDSVVVNKIESGEDKTKTATFTVEVSKGSAVAKEIEVKVTVANNATAYTVEVLTD